MHKKRLLIVVNYFYPYVSGVSEYARSVASSLSNEYEVTVLTCKHIPDLPTHEFFEGYTLIRTNPLFFLDKGYISPAFVGMFKRLAVKNDIINLHLPMLESGLLSLLSTRPLLLTYQCDMALVGSALNRLAVLGVRLSMRLALYRSQAIVVLSKDYANTSRLLCGQKNKLIEIAPPNRFENIALGELKTPRNKNTICGFVGRFVLEKGIEAIIDAARILKDEPFEFWLAGDYKDVAGGSVFESIKTDIELLGPKVRLLGRLSDEDLINFYRDIDVLLLPSTNRFEAFGMVQMEAMTFGATIVTSDMPGVRETVNKTGIGQLCKPSSGRSLAEAIQRSKKERERFSRAEVRASVQREFGNKKFVRSYMQLIDKLGFKNVA